MIEGIAVETTVDSKEASAVTRRSANVTARRRFGSNRGGAEDIGGSVAAAEAGRERHGLHHRLRLPLRANAIRTLLSISGSAGDQAG